MLELKDGWLFYKAPLTNPNFPASQNPYIPTSKRPNVQTSKRPNVQTSPKIRTAQYPFNENMDTRPKADIHIQYIGVKPNFGNAMC
jgi:hypothetical protein